MTSQLKYPGKLLLLDSYNNPDSSMLYKHKDIIMSIIAYLEYFSYYGEKRVFFQKETFEHFSEYISFSKEDAAIYKKMLLKDDELLGKSYRAPTVFPEDIEQYFLSYFKDRFTFPKNNIIKLNYEQFLNTKFILLPSSDFCYWIEEHQKKDIVNKELFEKQIAKHYQQLTFKFKKFLKFNHNTLTDLLSLIRRNDILEISYKNINEKDIKIINTLFRDSGYRPSIIAFNEICSNVFKHATSNFESFTQYLQTEIREKKLYLFHKLLLNELYFSGIRSFFCCDIHKRVFVESGRMNIRHLLTELSQMFVTDEFGLSPSYYFIHDSTLYNKITNFLYVLNRTFFARFPINKSQIMEGFFRQNFYKPDVKYKIDLTDIPKNFKIFK